MKELISSLNNILDILEEERIALINNDGEKIIEIVEDKNEFLKILEEYRGKNFSENIEIVQLIEKINSKQETNLLLTNQAINYNNLFLESMKSAVEVKASGYSSDGKIAKGKNINIIDQSL